ncbi:unnamed protein product [Urochloa humidicola]
MVSAGDGIERVLWTEAEVAARVGEVAAELAADLRALPEPAVAVGVATGAFLFLADLVRRVDVPLAVDFVRVESYGGGTGSRPTSRSTSPGSTSSWTLHTWLSLRLKILWTQGILCHVSLLIWKRKEHHPYRFALSLTNQQEGKSMFSLWATENSTVALSARTALLLVMVWIMQSSTATCLMLEFSSLRCTQRIQAIRLEPALALCARGQNYK